MDAIADRLREAAPGTLGGTPVVFAYLFGSHATGVATTRSDVDIAVHLGGAAPGGGDRLELRLQLADAIERAAGVGPVEVVVLDDAPLALRGRIQEHHVVLYSRDEVARVRYESLTSRMYHDFKIHEQRSASERLAALAETD